jgi:general stress protein YciG
MGNSRLNSQDEADVISAVSDMPLASSCLPAVSSLSAAATASGVLSAPSKSKKPRGFAAMSLEQRREIASLGGQSVPAQKRAFSRNRDLAAKAGNKGGKNVAPQKRMFSQDRNLAAKAALTRDRISLSDLFLASVDSASPSPPTSNLCAAAPAELSLSHGFVALIDAEDFERVSRYKWTAVRRHGGKLIYGARLETKDGKRRFVYLHRFILRAGNNQLIDHRNGDGLDNTKANLRFATPTQNVRNRHRTTARSGIRGVVFDASNNSPKPWRAFINSKGQRAYLGRFLTKEEAIAARKSAAALLFGEFQGSS